MSFKLLKIAYLLDLGLPALAMADTIIKEWSLSEGNAIRLLNTLKIQSY